MKSEDTTFKKTPKLAADDFTSIKDSPPTEKPEQDIYQRVFIPNWNNKPDEHKAIITLNGIPFLTYQNISTIIAPPGFGKSALCEAAAASYLNPEADCLGLKVDQACPGIIYIDNERTNLDVWNSFNRMCKRAGIKYGQEVPNVTIAGLRSTPRLKERLQTIESLLQNNPCGLLELDGAGDLVTDTNDNLQAVECRIFLREMTAKYQISILTTLHPNPGSFKPRGHIGSEIHRDSECVMVAKNYEGDYRILTSEFEFGKNRSNTAINAGYKWSEEHHMFVSVDFEEILNTKQNAKDAAKTIAAQKLAKQILQPLESLSYTELIKRITNTLKCSKPTAKRRRDEMEDWGNIIHGQDGNYRLKT